MLIRFKSKANLTKKQLYFNTTKFFAVFFIIIFISACSTNNFETTNSGLEYKILINNELGKSPEKGKIAELKFKYFGEKDSLLFDSEDIASTLKLKTNSVETSMFDEAILLLRTGEKGIFMINAENFFSKTQKKKIPDFIKKSEKLKFEITLESVIDQEEIEKAIIEKQKQLKNKEISERVDYIRLQEIKEEPTKTGIIIIKENQGKGNNTKPGDIVSIHYNAYLINGDIFDSTIEKDEPFTFKIGNKEVIPALEEAILTMKEGDKIKLITPSEQAYGEKGFGKLIPPYSTLIFEIKLINIKNNKKKKEVFLQQN